MTEIRVVVAEPMPWRDLRCVLNGLGKQLGGFSCLILQTHVGALVSSECMLLAALKRLEKRCRLLCLVLAS